MIELRSSWLVLALLVAGCFSEAPNAGGCVEGEAACDCRPDGTCVADHECIASIDKCVPNDCTPGSESCTCVDGGCLTGLMCDQGVCVPPSAATTGGDPSVATSISDTVVDTGPEPTMTTDDPTIPPAESSSTDVSVSISESMTADPSMADASDSGPAPECPECIMTAGQDVCETQYTQCATDVAAGGCSELMGCMNNQLVSTQQCCDDAQADEAIMFWNALVMCGQQQTCEGLCDRSCLVK